MDRTLVIILAAALVGRVALPIVSCALNGDTSRFHANDTDSYLLPAAGLLEDGTLGRDGHPEVIRTPGYSLFLVPGLLLGSVDWVTVFLQALLGTLTVFLVHRVTRSHFGGTSAALFAAGICVLEPLSVVYCGMLLTETIFTTLLVLFLCAILQHLKSGHSACLLVAAVTLSACAYVRPIAYPLAAPVAAVLLLPYAGLVGLRQRALRALLFLAVVAGLVSPWQIRNGVTTGYYGLSAISAISLYFYQGAAVRSVTEGVPFYRMQQEMGHADPDRYFTQHPDQRGWDAGRRYAYFQRRGLGLIAQHPATYAAIHLKGVARAVLDPGAVDVLKYLGLYPSSGGLLGVAVDRGLLAALSQASRDAPLALWTSLSFGLLLMAAYALAVLGFWRSPRGVPRLMIVLLVVYFVTLSGGPQSLGRFRHPIMPVIAMLAGAGAAAALDAARRRWLRPAKASPTHDGPGLTGR